MAGFKSVTLRNGQRYIVAPTGKRVIHWWFCDWARLGNAREWNGYFVDAKGKDAECVASTYGGLTRPILRYLNGKTDNFNEAELYDGDNTLRKLDRLSQKGNSHRHE